MRTTDIETAQVDNLVSDIAMPGLRSGDSGHTFGGSRLDARRQHDSTGSLAYKLCRLDQLIAETRACLDRIETTRQSGVSRRHTLRYSSLHSSSIFTRHPRQVGTIITPTTTRQVWSSMLTPRAFAPGRAETEIIAAKQYIRKRNRPRSAALPRSSRQPPSAMRQGMHSPSTSKEEARDQAQK